MTLTFIGENNSPNYLALSSDIADNKIEGASQIGGTILLTDTGAWKIIKQDLTLLDYTLPLSGGASMDAVDPTGAYHRLDTATPTDDEFSDESISLDWNSVRGSNTGTISWSEGRHSLNALSSGNPANTIHSQIKTATLADGEAFEALLYGRMNLNDSYPMAGVLISNGTLSSSNVFVASIYNAGNAFDIPAIWYGTFANASSAHVSAVAMSTSKGKILIRLFRTSATAFGMKMSSNGIQWIDIGTSYNPSFTPTHAGVFVSTWGGSNQAIASFEYFRKVTI